MTTTLAPPTTYTAQVRSIAAVPLPSQTAAAASQLPDWALPAVKPTRTSWPETQQQFAIRITDSDGTTGTYGPCSATVLSIIRDQLAPALLDWPVSRWWDLDTLHTPGRHHHGAHFRLAVSVIELAMWDLRGARAQQPAHVLLGGPVRETIPAYASALGIDIDHPLAREIAAWLAGQGYWGQKWSLPGATRDEPAARDADRLLRLRAATGTHARLMIDGLRRWTAGRLRYLAPVLAEVGVEWVEEPLLHHHPRLSGSLPVAIAGGEHAYDRADQIGQLTNGHLHVWQPEVTWHGGLVRALVTVDLAASHGIPSFPHAAGLPAALHLAALSDAIPAVEYHLTLDPCRHAVLQQPPTPSSGAFTLPDVVGVAGPYVTVPEAAIVHLAGDHHAT